MLLSEIKLVDIELPEDANRVNPATDQVPHAQKLTDPKLIMGALAALPTGTQVADLNDRAHRLTLFGVLYHAGLCRSTHPGRYPLASVKEVSATAIKRQLIDFLVVPETDRVIAVRKDGTEYREGGVPLVGRKAPKGRFDNAEHVIKRNTNGIVRAIRLAARAAAKRLKSEAAASPKPKPKPKRKKGGPNLLSHVKKPRRGPKLKTA